MSGSCILQAPASCSSWPPLHSPPGIAAFPPSLLPLLSFLPEPNAGGTAAKHITSAWAAFSSCCVPPRPSSRAPGVHSTTKARQLQRTLHHHESKFFCFINLRRFYRGVVAIHFPTVFPVVPSISSKSINPRHSNKWQVKNNPRKQKQMKK